MSERREMSVKRVRELVNAKEADIEMAFARLENKLPKANEWKPVSSFDRNVLAIDAEDCYEWFYNMPRPEDVL